ncbi:cysteine-rich repeat secretory protein 55-like [Mercurialis annua]|uniref:cysteine-rich repeat secretory protein 55-like n=1 Tax=Mercurialis annua TaxID=3986 RepID=UPI00215F0838|nr:cysteine-rich repeat secretory protein 55-like [Mercurialis annua]
MALLNPNVTHLLPLLLITLFLFTCNGEDDSLGYLCNEDTSTNAKISANIDAVLPKLVSKASSLGHFVATSGGGRDKVYGLAQCRGDISKADCSGCLHKAAELIRQACRDQPDSRIWRDHCFLRYNIENFIGKIDTSFGYLYVNVKNVTYQPNNFNKAVSSLMNKVKSEAVVPKNKGISKGLTKFSSSVTVYGLVQCTGDIGSASCGKCVNKALSNISKYCTNRKGCNLMYSNCFVRYEVYPFYFPEATNSTAPVGATFLIMLED